MRAWKDQVRASAKRVAGELKRELSLEEAGSEGARSYYAPGVEPSRRARQSRSVKLSGFASEWVEL